MSVPSRRPALLELAGLFLKLGIVSFGGPAAHVALLEDEVVRRRRWLTPEHFLDLVGATNLIPGPNSTEMVMHVGYERARWAGLVTAGLCFILPAATISAVLGWLYLQYGSLPQVAPLLVGIQPAVLAIIAGALYRLARPLLRRIDLLPAAVATLVALLLGTGEVAALFIGTLLGAAFLLVRARQAPSGPAAAVLPLMLAAGAPGAPAAFSVWQLALFFLKVGSVLYGSGYVLFAFLEGGLVVERGWLTSRQLLDAVAVGQFTPGPVLSTAAFIGYLLGGATGAALSTVAIFLPSFVFTGLLNPLVPRLRANVRTRAFLDAVNTAALVLMLVVMVRLGATALVSWPAWVILALALVATLLGKLSAPLVVVAGAVLGYLFTFL